jgi:Zn-dependent M28 family amino/carboxypeptidase
MRLARRFLLPALALALSACAGAQTAPAPVFAVDSARLMHDLRVLAHDSMEGRLVGTEGNARARRFLLEQYQRIGLQPVGAADLTHPFSFVGRDSVPRQGVNVLGIVRGTVNPDRYIVVTAHYDHLGVRNGEIYNGADDNASGTSGLLELARYFTAHRPRNSIVFAALDAEEGGLHGAHAFVRAPPVALDRVVMNVNMDMVGRNDRNELYAAGTYHYPFLRPYLEEVATRAPITLRFGHDSPDLGPDDWTMQSDHGVFHQAGIPFIYFGVEDHPDYHRPTDTADRIQPAFYAGAIWTVLASLLEFDAALGEIERAR